MEEVQQGPVLVGTFFYDVCGASMCPWDMGGGLWSPLGSSRPLFNDFRADTML